MARLVKRISKEAVEIPCANKSPPSHEICPSAYMISIAHFKNDTVWAAIIAARKITKINGIFRKGLRVAIYGETTFKSDIREF